MELFEIEKDNKSIEIYDANKKISICVTELGEVCVISLPEPQRTEFINKIKELNDD